MEWLCRERLAVSSGLLSVVLNWNTLHGDFVMDDKMAVVGNPDVSGNRSIAAVFANDFWGMPFAHARSHKCYRPLTVLTFRANFLGAQWLGGSGLEPRGFHAVNIVCAALNVVLAAMIMRRLFGEGGWWRAGDRLSVRRVVSGDARSIAASPSQSQSQSLSAVAGAYVFASHPVHSEAVANIVGRAELLAAFFALLSFLTLLESLPSPARTPLTLLTPLTHAPLTRTSPTIKI
eukprot:Tamp_28129.p1 GENE.Tamp_28129~~Tamp_28129.p1  ORF type:complete len:233 (+),score=20.39 Tamp_28129:50-748(+)